MVCILGAGALALGSQMSLMDPYSFRYRRVELVWTHGARILGVLAVAASVCALCSYGGGPVRFRVWAVRILTATAVAIIFGIVHPGVIAFLLGLQLIAIRRLGSGPAA